MEQEASSHPINSTGAFEYLDGLFGTDSHHLQPELRSAREGFVLDDDSEWLTAALEMSPFLSAVDAPSLVPVASHASIPSLSISPLCGKSRCETTISQDTPQTRVQELGDAEHQENSDLVPTPMLIEDLLIPRQQAVMKPLLKKAGKKRTRDPPAGVMVFELPERSLKRTKPNPLKQEIAKRAPRGLTCFLCSMNKIKCERSSRKTNNTPPPCFSCLKRSFVLGRNICVPWQIESIYINDISTFINEEILNRYENFTIDLVKCYSRGDATLDRRFKRQMASPSFGILETNTDRTIGESYFRGLREYFPSSRFKLYSLKGSQSYETLGYWFEFRIFLIAVLRGILNDRNEQKL